MLRLCFRRCGLLQPYSQRIARFSSRTLLQRDLQASKVVLSLEDLPLPEKARKRKKKREETTDEADSEPELTDFYQNIKNTVDKYSGDEYVVLIQVGSFYELYFEQAEKYAGALGIALTRKKLKRQNVAFAGFPDYKLNKYLGIIFKLGLKAVVCDQMADEVTKRIERPVTRLITPGTVLEEDIRDYHYNNHLLAISFPEDPFKDLTSVKIGLAWCDIGLGTFYVLETTINDLMANITRISPSEILIDKSIDTEKLVSGRWYPELGGIRNYYLTRRGTGARKKLLSFVDRFAENPRLMMSTIDQWATKEKAASSMLLHYLEECVPFYNIGFSLPIRSLPDSMMSIDARAATDLELTRTMRTGFRTGALATVIDHTSTPQGSRLLKSWLLSPSTEPKTIKRRQRFVKMFIKHKMLTEELRTLLKNASDITRILRRIANGRAEPSELLEIANTVALIQSMKTTVENAPAELKKLLKTPLQIDDEIAALTQRIAEVIETDSPALNHVSRFDFANLNRSWAVKASASETLAELKGKFAKLVDKQEKLVDDLTEQLEQHGFTGSFKLSRDMRNGEFIIDVKSSSKALVSVLDKSGVTYKDHTKSGAKIVSNEWKQIGHDMIYLTHTIFEEEERILEGLKSSVLELSRKFRLLSPNIEFLDVMMSFAELSEMKNLSCPEVNNGTELSIEEGRHLVVEEGLKDISVVTENFTRNSCHLDTESTSTWVITGPNMGGKSTFLRQNAIIVIMAQMGCFVPATSAVIGVVDKIFTRVGSSDNIYRHESTFMVEMNEASIILRDATPRSLAIVDELGRGTSIREGIAVAYASLAYLVKHSSCKVLFATHYGPELADLIKGDSELAGKVRFFRTSASSIRRDSTLLPVDEKLVFNHRLEAGISDHSHALDIAEISGFPAEAIEIAEKTLKALE